MTRKKQSLKNLLPPLSREELAALKASIEDRGVLHPVVVDEDGQVLDGRHRLRIDPNAPRRVLRGLSPAEKMAFTLHANFARRNLSPAQKKAALATMREVALALRAEDPKKNTQRRIGRLLGVSRECVAKWLLRGRRDAHDGTSPNLRDESAFLADARFTIPARLRPEIVRRREAGQSAALLVDHDIRGRAY